MQLKSYLFLFIALSLPALAQAWPKTLKCTFNEKYTAFELKNGAVNPIILPAEDFSLVFDSINLSEGKGRLIGNVGAADVQVYGNNDVLNLIELTPAGLPNTTTILAVKTDEGYKAITSRHMAVAFKNKLQLFFPSQKTGFCKELLND